MAGQVSNLDRGPEAGFQHPSQIALVDVRAREALVTDLAYAVASIVEGGWLNQCLTARHPTDPSEPIATALRRSGLLLWRGATEPRSG